MSISIKILARSSHPYGGNAILRLEISGTALGAPLETVVLRQGSLGIWAFRERPRLARAQQDELDRAVDAELKRWDALKLELCPCCQSQVPELELDPLCGGCTAEGFWMDPAGTIHAPGADAAKAYE